MKMPEIEIQKICKMANFLDDKGYTRTIDKDTILYESERTPNDYQERSAQYKRSNLDITLSKALERKYKEQEDFVWY